MGIRKFSLCKKSHDQVREETIADYLQQRIQPGETVGDGQLKRSAFIDGIQSGVFNVNHQGVSQAAACDGLIYFVNYSGQNLDIQGHPLLLFEDQH